MEQAAAFGVVHLLGGGEGQQLIARAIEQFTGDLAQIRIGDVIARSSDGAARRKKKADDTPKIAFVEDGNIYIEPITKDVLNDIKL